MSYDHGRFVWFELISADASGAQAFYGEVLGWKHRVVSMPGGMEYPMALVADQPLGGYAPPPGDLPPHWVSYLSVDDVDAAAKRLATAGGKVLMDAFDAPGVGRMQPVADPQGAVFFLFKGQTQDTDAPSGPGSFHWNELVCADPQAAVAFYREVFGFEVDATPMPTGDYHILRNGEHMRGGIAKSPVEGPAHWVQYFRVDDCDAAAKRITTHGGALLGEPMDIEGVGRFVHAQDRLGAHFAVIRPA